MVYRGEQRLPGADALLPALAELQINYVFVTNNSTTTPADVTARLSRLGVQTTPDHVVTSGQATAAYLRARAGAGECVLVVGEQGLRDAIEEVGLAITDTEPAYVVVGLDRGLTYDRLHRASAAIRAGATFVATNADAALPVEGGFIPGAGAIVAAVATTTGVEPLVIGKPNPGLLEAAMSRVGAKPQTTAMVGDQLESDIRAGQAAGTMTILVGHDLWADSGDVVPDLHVESLEELIAYLRQ